LDGVPFRAEVDALRVAETAETQAVEYGAEQQEYALGVFELAFDERPDALEVAGVAFEVVGVCWMLRIDRLGR
jgi:hypothetical protein